MTEDKRKSSVAIDRAAEVVGHALGTVAGTIDSLQAQHPHPVDEMREALTAGQETLAAIAADAGTRASSVIKKAKAVARRTKKSVAQARRKSKPAVARVTRAAKKMVKRAKKAVKRGRKTPKTMSRAAGRRKR